MDPEGKNRKRLTLWQRDRYDETNFLVVQSDPWRLSYERELVELYRDLTVPGSRPGRLTWLKKESNASQGVLKGTFSVYGVRYDGDRWTWTRPSISWTTWGPVRMRTPGRRPTIRG